MKEKKGRNLVPFLATIFSLLVMAGIFTAIFFYNQVYKPNVDLKGKESWYLYIRTGSRFADVDQELGKVGILKNRTSFERVARWKKYISSIKAGRYRITDKMSSNDLVNLLRSGRQEPVNLTIRNTRTIEEFAGLVSRQIEADSVSLLRMLNDPSYLRTFDASPGEAYILFLPDTYQFYWNTSADQFIRRMAGVSKKFWNPARVGKSRKLEFSIPQIIILASIVESETGKDSEKPEIAGVYMNRLKKGWPLQADPTLLFAWNDPSIRRVMNKHLEIDSPYNTYKHTGLPPGPVCLPTAGSIDAVLNYSKNNYMFFCAKADFSGFHNFASTLDEHNRNAREYQSALKKKNIR